ncbi:hypothetical protein WMF38_21290 [Sorangium sp. So ce118]
MEWSDYQNLVVQIGDLRREAADVFQQVVLPQQATGSYAQTLYGYMHRSFGFIDVLSSYWKGNDDGNQSTRMVDFMEKYLGPNRRAHSIAVQIWRHKLVHTAFPRNLRDSTTGGIVGYLIQWHETQMTSHQPHYTILSNGRDEVFNLACISFLEDLEGAAARFVADVETSPLLQENAAKFARELDGYRLKVF